MHSWIKQIQIARDHVPHGTVASALPMLIIGSLQPKSPSLSLISPFTPRTKVPDIAAVPGDAETPPPPTVVQAVSSDAEAAASDTGGSGGGGAGSWFRRRKAGAQSASIGLATSVGRGGSDGGSDLQRHECSSLLADNRLLRQQLSEVLDVVGGQPPVIDGSGGGTAAVVLELQQQTARLALDLSHTKDALRVSQEREIMLEELSKELRHVSQKTVDDADAQGANDAEMVREFTVVCVCVRVCVCGGGLVVNTPLSSARMS